VSSSRPISEAQADAHLRGGSVIVDRRDVADDSGAGSFNPMTGWKTW
jgi:hypothetical protein